MARGFESKDIEYQQAERERPRETRPALTSSERELAARRRTLELALSNARAQRAAASRPNHKQMLDHAILALDEELRTLA